MKFYIYKIINKINGKCYIGKHKTFEGETFRAYMGSGVALVEAQRKYGLENKKEKIKKMKRVKGKSHFYNNGVINVIDQSCPVGFKPGRIKNW